MHQRKANNVFPRENGADSNHVSFTWLLRKKKLIYLKKWTKIGNSVFSDALWIFRQLKLSILSDTFQIYNYLSEKYTIFYCL